MIHSIHIIDTGLFKLDGGAMFGVVPKSMWNKLNPSDDNNMCTWALRCVLLKCSDRNILIDCGMGTKQAEKFRSHFYPHGEGELYNSLAKYNVTPEDITDVILTHLHFDHCGGAVQYNNKGELAPSFPNAKYWSNKTHWNWALKPNERERNSFLHENFVPLEQQGLIHFIEESESAIELFEGIKVHYCSGHTKNLMTIEFDFMGQNYFYPTDLIPSSHHIGVPYIMAYDIQPLLTLKEKEFHLNRCVEKNSILIFEHDPLVEACTVVRNDKGRIVKERSVSIEN
ncbi:MAG: MBL fold metallo-hydrolase [Saprospiraceae bacterium]|nr:MBL fold metallo-hydrolase [Saprospiraceae bacterium]